MKRFKWRKLLAVGLSFSIAISNSTVMTYAGDTDLLEDTDTPEEMYVISDDYSKVYSDGCIRIYNLAQLKAIGTNQKLKDQDYENDSFGLGDNVVVNGKELTYSLDANYVLENDIPLNSEGWHLPEGFSGTFSTSMNESEYPLFEESTDTIYIYNSYQLDMMLSEHSEENPLLSLDYDVDQFGKGQLVYQGQNDEYVTYSTDHRYVLSRFFTERRPMTAALNVQSKAETSAEVLNIGVWGNASLSGRDYIGQVYHEDQGVKYILIGNKQQLKEIGSGKQVTPTLILHNKPGLLDPKHSYTPLYPGDADFDPAITLSLPGSKDTTFQYFNKESHKDQIMNVDFTKGLLGSVTDALGGILGGFLGGDSEIVGYNSVTGKYIDERNLKKEYGDLKYTKNANYIIFRDIDLKNTDWKPLMFSGVMIGAIGEAQGSLWTGGSRQPVISNVSIHQKGDLNTEKQSGIGFFGSIMSTSKKQIGIADQQVVVKNIKLKNVSVQNDSSKIKNNTGLVGGLLDILGSLLGGLLGDLGAALDALLNPAKHADPTVFATGAFVGRVSGHVKIEGCEVENVTNVSNVRDFVGGFAGHVEGVTEYGTLQETLGKLVRVLEEVLNILPLVDLGTLIEVLLDGNIIKIDQLIPTGYKGPEIIDCHVKHQGSLSIGRTDQNFVGGFAGKAVGTVMKDCHVSVSHLALNGKNMVGGINGYTANAELVGLLNDLGVDLIPILRLNSFLLNCQVLTDTLQVSGTEKYSGGLSGATANSFIVDGQVSGLTTIQSKSYAGGITGIATLGQAIGLGDYYGGNKNLLQLITGVVSKILNTTDENEKENLRKTLLSLSGIHPSVLAGNEIIGETKVEVTEGYAGGLVGQGDGVVVVPSSATDLENYSFTWKHSGAKLGYTLKNRNHLISNLKEVKGKNYIGGVIGEAVTASTTALLDQTLGVAKFLEFNIKDIRVTNTAIGTMIQAFENYAGGFAGKAVGGNIVNAHITELKNVTAQNYVGGFVGYGGTGSLAETAGLNILGLIKISNLLSLAKGFVLDIKSSSVAGVKEGLSVEASGSHQVASDKTKYYAGGFIGKSTSVHLDDATVKNVRKVTADVHDGYAGGFSGVTETGGLADAAGESSDALNLIGIQGLIHTVPYLVSDFKKTTVHFIPSNEPQVKASYAGGFIGEMQSGVVDNSQLKESYAVYNATHIQGEHYSGGFAGKIYSGGLASANGLSVLNGALNINIDHLLSLLDVYIPTVKHAGVMSKGLVVETLDLYKNDLNSGSAGGYVGYASGANISDSDVHQLKHTKVNAPSDLNSDDGSSYFDATSSYAVTGVSHAGGYVGKLDIGSSASLGQGIDLAGLVQLNSITQALDVVASKIQNCNVYGSVGGFSVKADGLIKTKDIIGHAGGFAGAIYGSQLQDANAYNFNYIIGQETAGGYAGTIQPGNVASVLGKTEILGGLLTTTTHLLSILQSFIPMIYNSETTCVPCGGAVRANAPSDAERERGLAGGYVGYNLGGRIEGNSDREVNHIVPQIKRENAVYRLRSVYGYEFAGGFSGRTKSANVADTGNISVLFGLIKLSNPLEAISAVYATETHTAVYGPLRGLDVETWNQWVDAVGVNGSYGQQLQEIGPVQSQEQLNDIIHRYAYGYDVKAARKEAGSLPSQGGVSGGYVGRMDGCVISSAQAMDLKTAVAYRSSGGFVGEMMSAGVANVGGLTLAGIDIDGSLPVLQTFVPVIRDSKTIGYQSGATVISQGYDLVNQQGMAGGFAGLMVGGQIQGDANHFVSIEKLKKVKGTNAVGGFVGSVVSGSATNLDVASDSGLLPGILGPLLGDPKNLAKVLNATVSTIDYAKVDAWDPWGIIIDGSYTKENNANTLYADTVGGFAGTISGAILGDRKAKSDSLIVNQLRNVIGGQHVGGFFGLGDVAALAQVGDNHAKPILGLIKLGELDVLDTFRTYIYHATVQGSKDYGLKISAHKELKSGTLNSARYTGNAGGFGGSLLDGSVKDSNVINLRDVDGLNYVGGFIGHLGKSGVVDLDKVGTDATIINGLLNATAGVMDHFGSHIDRCQVVGQHGGYVVKSVGGTQPIAGGFTGYADLAKIDDCHATFMKKMVSDQIAGGFVGQTDFAYLGDIDAGSKALLKPILVIINTLLDYLYVGELENLDAIKIDLGKLLTLDILSDGNVLSVTLLGLKISVALIKNNGNGTTDVAQIHIGDSFIELPCSDLKGNHIKAEDEENIKIGLIKANRTKIENSSTSGIAVGYDVFGGGATDTTDGTHQKGMSGGFVGYNHEGLLQNNDMFYADTIRGTAQVVGPFHGFTDLNSNYTFNTIRNIEGQKNNYRVYRDKDGFKSIYTAKGLISKALESNLEWNEFVIDHIVKVEEYDEFQKAYLASPTTKKDANVYITSSKAVLMEDTSVPENMDSTTPPPSEMQDPCDEFIDLTINKVWKDLSNIEKLRPGKITVHLTRSYMVDGRVIQDAEFNQSIEISSSTQTNLWQHVVQNLPAYKVLDDGTHAYYTYMLSEDAVDRYETSIETSEDGFTITITNSRLPILPDTGGGGTFIFTIVGLVGILIILKSYRRREENEKCS